MEQQTGFKSGKEYINKAATPSVLEMDTVLHGMSGTLIFIETLGSGFSVSMAGRRAVGAWGGLVCGG